jgi:ABC-type multidrug transport system ATPase subunit
MTVTVSVNGVEKSYGRVRALRNVSFDLGPGRLSALVGHNGAGKTTLIKLMLGLIRADRGAIRVLNEDPAAGEFSARRQLGYLPENVAFNAALTGRETLIRAAEADQASHGMGAARPRRSDGCRRSPGWNLFQGHAATFGFGPGSAGTAAGAVARRADNGSRPCAAPDLL